MCDLLTPLANKRILLGVTGGIAAYKSAELTRLLRASGAEVRVVMTQAATAFVGVLTFQALSGHRVYMDLLDAGQEVTMGHIQLARWADLVLIAPASADFMARLRLGLADDLLATLCLATEAPIILAPAMNRVMWQNVATQDNLHCLEGRGISRLGPAEGEQACGETGLGRMLEPVLIRDALLQRFSPGKLANRTVLITAGPTREPIDPVRYISNRSSGKMGYSLTQAARAEGAQVTLVSGPVALTAPYGIERVSVETAEQMYAAVMARAASHDIFIGAAAVADYSPVQQAEQKIKKQSQNMNLSLRKTQDILAEVAGLKNRPFTVGFAAETDQLERYAEAKFQKKSLDMIAANQVGQAQGGFESEENALLVIWKGGRIQLPMAPKSRIAQQLIELIAHHYEQKNPTQSPG